MIATLPHLPSDVRPTDRVIHLKKYQDDFIFSTARYPALISAWGTGKTLCLIEKVRLAAEQYPKNLILVLRKEFVDLRDSTIKDWEQYTGIKVNSSRDAVFPNGSIVMFRHAEELRGNNLNNINLGAGAIEQGEELETDEVFFKLQGRLRRQGVENHFLAVIGNTAGHNWIYKLWKANAGNDPAYPLFEADSFANADVLPSATIEDWKKLKDKKPKIYNRFVLNSWDEADTTDVVISAEWVRTAVGRRLVIVPPLRRIVSIDVARYGDDKTIMYFIENGYSRAKAEHEKKSTMETVGRAILFAEQNNAGDWYAVDEIGVGGGVVDRLVELGKHVIAVNSSEKATDGSKCYNRRAEIYTYGAQMMEEGYVQIAAEDHDLQEQLSWAKFKTIKSNGYVLVQPNDEIKETYGRSPDNASAFLNGIWALQFVPAIMGDGKRDKMVGWVHPRFRQGFYENKPPHLSAQVR